MTSFYGGPQGQSFKISEIFENKVALETDLGKAWNSPIGVGEYIAISYGAPGSVDYIENLDIDKNATKIATTDSLNFNATIWQKYFDEDLGILNYKLLFYVIGNTPEIDIEQGTDLDAGSSVVFEETAESIRPDKVVYQVRFPKGQSFNTKVYVEEIAAGGSPAAQISTSGTYVIGTETVTATVNNPVLVLSLPTSSVLQNDVLVEELAANEQAAASIKTTDYKGHTATVNNPLLVLSLPKYKEIVALNGAAKHVNEDPEVTSETSSDGKRVELTFNLPKSQNIDVVGKTAVAGSTPTAQLIKTASTEYPNASVDTPVLEIILPLGQSISTVKTEVLDADGTPDVDFDDTNKTNPTITFKLPKSQIMDSTVDFQELTPENSPEVSLGYRDATKNTPYLSFKIPRTVRFISGTLLGTQENGTVDISVGRVGDWYINVDTGCIYEFTSLQEPSNRLVATYRACLQAPVFDISEAEGIDPYDASGASQNPTVTRVYNSTSGKYELQFELPKAPQFTMARDRLIPYVNRENARMTATMANGAVSLLSDLVIGPVGDALQIIGAESISSLVIDNVTADVGTYLESDRGYTDVSPEQLIAVSYVNGDDILSYWYFKPGDPDDNSRAWARLLLSSGSGGNLQPEYSEDPAIIEERAYSVDAVNKMLFWQGTVNSIAGENNVWSPEEGFK